MKKIKLFRNLLLSASFLFLALNADAQWANNAPHIYNTNSGYVGVGINTPSNLLHAAKNMTGAQMIIENLGGSGGAGFTMIDANSTANWKFKATNTGGFKIRDHASAVDVIQIEQNSAPDAIYIGSNGLIGFGTNAPADLHGFGARIDVDGDILMRDANAFLQLENTLANSNCGLVLSEEGAYTSWIWYSGSGDYLTINADPGGGFRQDIIVKSTGEVGIGTATTKTGYRLSVDGKIVAEELLIEDSGSWPDYVFEDGYELMSLEQLEESIEQNNHLPGLPNASEVEENGFSVGEMQKIFLEKLEELTLYTIAQEKRIKALEQENEKLRK